MARSSRSALEEFDSNRLEIVRGDFRSEFDLAAALNGIEFVYHLAVAHGAKTWEDQLRNNVEPTRQVGDGMFSCRGKATHLHGHY